MSLFTKPIRILLLTDGLVMVASSMLIPFFAVFVERVGGDILEIGIAASLFAVAGGVAVLIAGRFADRVRRKEFIIASAYLVLAIGFASYLLVDSIWLLLITQVVVGLAEASYLPAFDALYGDHAHEGGKHAGRRWSFTEANDYFAAAIGAGLGAVIVHFLGFDTLFIAMAALSLIASVYLFMQPASAFARPVR